jgi:hypothetical protein
MPSSVMVFGTKSPRNPSFQFDFIDLHQPKFVSIRLGDVGIVAVFDDGGALELFSRETRVPKYLKTPLHPAQFLEVASQIAYKSSLHRRSPLHLFGESKRGIHVYLLGAKMGATPDFADWIMRDFVHVQSAFLRIRPEVLFVNEHQCRTFLKQPDGKFLDIDPDVWPEFEISP